MATKAEKAAAAAAQAAANIAANNAAIAAAEAKRQAEWDYWNAQTLAEQERARQETAINAAAAEKAAAETSSRKSAGESLALMFRAYGLESLTTWIIDSAVAGKNMAQISAEIYDQPEYQKRFPAMASLRSRGEVVSEEEYISLERSYKQALEAYGLRGSVYDDKKTYTSLIDSGVDVQELEERLQDAKMVVDAADPNIRNVLAEQYGIGSSDLLAYALDPKGQGRDHVEKLARSATLQGLARSMSLNMDKTYAENLAMDTAFDNSTEADYRNALSNVTDLATSQRRLAGIEGTTFTDMDAADVVVKKDARKTLASRDRAAREAARFGGTSGLSSGTLRGSGI